MMKAEFFMARFGALHALIHEEKAFGSNICAEKSGDQQHYCPKVYLIRQVLKINVSVSRLRTPV